MNVAAIIGALATLMAASAPVQSPGEPSLELTTARFYRSSSSQTLVDVFCLLPFVLLDPLSQGPGGVAAYRMALSVRDSAGLELLAQSWSRMLPSGTLRLRGASTVEHFVFGARPGHYLIEVAVTDSASGRVSRQSGPVDTYPGSPGASDLLLASGIRPPAGPVDTVPRAGEIRKGSVFLETSGRPVLTPQQTRLGYYLEVYPQQAETVAVRVRVKAAAGTPIVATEAQRVPFEAGGGVTRGVVDLAGLPPGSYRLEVAVAARDSDVVRSAEFGMAGFETEAAIAAAAPPSPREPLDAMTEAQLDLLYLPLIYLMTSDEQGSYSSLTVEGKRRFLRQFWARRDPTPGTLRNEAQEDFYARIGEANRRFREGGAAEIPGWRTDRGRIFVRYGLPDEVLSRPQAGSTLPYDVWKYTRGRLRKFVFLDLTRFGNYSLIWTDDRREPSRPDWRDQLGPEAVQDVERF